MVIYPKNVIHYSSHHDSSVSIAFRMFSAWPNTIHFCVVIEDTLWASGGFYMSNFSNILIAFKTKKTAITRKVAFEYFLLSLIFLHDSQHAFVVGFRSKTCESWKANLCAFIILSSAYIIRFKECNW